MACFDTSTGRNRCVDFMPSFIRVNQLSSYLRYVGPFAGAFPILSLRTSKADVVVGVDQAKADALDTSGEKWRVNGK